jgi:hypothetical protein
VGNPGNSNFPDSSVQLTQLLLVSVFVSRTVAEGTGAPSAVFTVPMAGAVAEVVAVDAFGVSDCAAATIPEAPQTAAKNAAGSNNRRKRETDWGREGIAVGA